MGRSANVHDRSRLLDAASCRTALRIMYGHAAQLPAASLRDASGNASPAGERVSFGAYAAACRRARQAAGLAD